MTITLVLCYCRCSVAKLCLTLTPWTTACQASLSFTISLSLPKFMFIASVIPSNHLILNHPLPLLPWSFPGSGSLPMSQLFASGGQSTGASASTSVLLMNIQGWFPLGLTTSAIWRRKWQCTPASLPGESHGQRSLAGYKPCGHRVRHDKWLSTHSAMWVGLPSWC